MKTKLAILCLITVLAVTSLPTVIQAQVTPQSTQNPFNDDTLANLTTVEVRNGYLYIDTMLSTNIGVSELKAIFAITIQKPSSQVFTMTSMTAILTTTLNEYSYSVLLPSDVHGIWSAAVMVFRDDGETALGVNHVTFTI